MIRRAVTVFAMILFAAVPSAQATEIPFGAAEELASGLVGGVGGVPVMVQGDLDGDGDADIAVAIAASASNGGVWWFENLGTDGFAAEQLIAGCAEGGFLCRVNDIQLVDMDSDGDLDLLGANFASVSDTIGWYPNDGLGNFGAPTLVRVSGGARLEHVTAADFDGDGDLDVAAVNRSPAAIAWYTNNGGGTFNTGTENAIDTLSVNSSNVIHADVDGDGDVDLVACNGFADVVWFENTDGAGTFSTKQTIATPPEGIDRVRVGDIDGDGDIDALSSYSVGGRDLNWHENTAGDGSAWTLHVVDAGPGGIWGLQVIDLDLDGDNDLLAPQRFFGNNAIWYENTSGDGSTWTENVFDDTPNGLAAVVASDVDNDGDLDVAVTNRMEDEVFWYENRTIHRNAPFGAPITMDNTINDPLGLELADLDRDGDTDAVIAGRLDSLIAWFENDGGSPSGWTKRTVSTPGNFPEGVAVADIDGDGDLDIASSPRNNAVDWLESDGATTPGFTVRTISGTVAGGSGNDTAAGDIDGDGDTDLMILAQDLGWYENDGGSPPGWTERVIEAFVTNSRTVELADIDGDGDLDALAGLISGTTVAWYENDGVVPPGWTKRTIASPAGVQRADAIDVDRDGDLDVVASSSTDGKVYWYENDGGSPPIWTPHDVALSTTTRSTHPVDFDLDGDIDFVSAPAGGGILWHENTGATPPEWTTETLWDGAVGISILHFDAGDFDGDGDPDLFATAAFADTLYGFENVGGQFGFTGSDPGAGLAYDGESTAALEVVAKVNGRSGDSVGRLATLKLETLDANGGVALSSGQANALIENVHIYRDADESGTFDADVDTLVMTEPPFGGVQTVVLPVSGPDVLVAAPVSFFVVPELTADASTQPVNTFAISHLSETGPSSMVDAGAGIQLLAELSPDFEGQTIVAAVSFVVDAATDAVDANPGDGACTTAGAVCTLRAAIQEANARAGDDRIVLPAGTFTLTVPGTTEDSSATGDLDIANNGTLTIIGQGAETTIIDAATIDRVFHVLTDATLTLEDLTITGGLAPSGQEAGGLWSDGGEVTIRRCAIRGNEAANAFATAVRIDALALKTFTMEDSVVHDNPSGIADATFRTNGNILSNISDSTFSNNLNPLGGVVIENVGGMTLRDCTVANNQAGGIRSPGGNVTLINTIVAGNNFALALDNDDVSTGVFISGGHNLVGETASAGLTNGVNDDQIGSVGSRIDPEIEPLGDYGGPTLTHSLQPSSPAIDAGSCSTSFEDQRGESRPVDIPGVADVDDGCDIGAFEAKLGQTQAELAVPVRWCGVNGAPSIDNPALVGETSQQDVLRKRHERAGDEIYIDQTNISFVSAANELIPDYPMLDDPACASGCAAVGPGDAGDIFVDPDTLDFQEFDEIVSLCREAWQAADPKVTGITAVQVDRFVDETGAAIGILGIGGEARENDPTQQASAGRAVVTDGFYRPQDTLDQLLGHEMGHALSLRHGNGLDDDLNGFIDDEDDPGPKLDGTNLMQYRNGTGLTSAQGAQARTHINATIPDVLVQPLSDTIPDGTPIAPETVEVLSHGYSGLEGVDVRNDIVKKFKNDIVQKFQNDIVKKFRNDIVKKFKNDIVKRFEQSHLPSFGATIGATDTIVHASTGSLPWPAPIQPRLFFHYYLDLDNDDSTGAYPADVLNPSDPGGNNFPGANNFANAPDIASESGVDMVAQVEMWVECPVDVCNTFAELRVFDYNAGSFVEVHFDNDIDIEAETKGLYQEIDGEFVERDGVPGGLTFQPKIPNSVLTTAGYTFPVGAPAFLRMEVVSSVECDGNIVNSDPTTAAVDCQCTDCVDCPDYPGCVAGVGTPDTLNGTRVLTDAKAGLLTFEPPRLPRCAISPALAGAGQSVTAYLSNLPTTITPAETVQIALDGAVLGSVSTGSIDAGGNLSIAATLPATATGDLRLTARITDTGVGVNCAVAVTPGVPCLDSDGDGDCDSVDTDDDNDGVPDGPDPAPLNPLSCGDADLDTCDDCTSGVNDPANDGPDFDLDGDCDAFDTDDDGDGVSDGSDCAPLNPAVDAAPADVTGLAIASDKTTFAWDAPLPGDGGGTQVQLLRGTADQLPVGAGAETCVGTTGGTLLTDATVPASGETFWYLLRRTNVCGGTYGFESGGGERTTVACP